MSPLTYATHQRLQSELVSFDRSIPQPAVFYAVDFDHLIIHANRYTWDEWCDSGKPTYPMCQPIPEGFLLVHSACFSDFVDMREKASV